MALGGLVVSGLGLSACIPPSISDDDEEITTSTTTSSTTLAAPSQLVVGSITGPSITLSWTDNATSETEYQVQMCTGANCTSFSAVSASPLAANATTHTESGLANGTVYRFRIRASNSSKNSNWLTSGNLTTPGVPSAPTGLSAATGMTGVRLTWNAVSGAADYDVELCTASACTYANYNNVTTNSADVTGLTANTGYRFRVRANNTVGSSSYTTTSTITTLNAVTSDPTFNAVTNLGNTSVTVNWNAVTSGSVGFLLEQCDAGCATCQAAITIAQANPPTTSYSFTGLTENTAYCFRIQGFQGPETADWSNPVTSADTTTLATPSDPSGVTATQNATDTTDTTVTVRWTDNSTNETGFQIDTIASSTCSSFTGATTTTAAANATSSTITGLSPNTDYCFRVRAVAAGPYYSAYATTAATPSTTTLSVPTAPSEFFVSSISSSGIELKWQDRSSDETRWEVARCDAASFSDSCTTFNVINAGGCDSTGTLNAANVTRCLDTSGITNGTYYHYRARAVNTDGNGVDRESDWVTISTPVTPKADVAPIGTNGTVYALARAGDTVYLGGSFSYAGPVTGPLVRMSSGSSTVVFGNLVLTDQVNTATASVHAIVSDGAGGYYLGGQFTHVDGADLGSAGNLIHVLSDGSRDTAWTAGTNGPVHALAKVGDYLVVGGDFGTLANVARDNLGSVNIAGASPLLVNWNPAPNGIVYSLAVSGSGVYFGGAFTQVNGGTNRGGLAYASAVTGTDGSNYITTFCNGLTGVTGGGATVRALALNGTNVILGGDFSTLNTSSTRNYIAEVTSACAATSWNPGANGAVNTLLVNGGTVYVGGSFTTLSSSTRNYFGALTLDVTSNYVQNLNPAPNGKVLALHLYSSNLYVGGAFTTFGGSTRYRAAAISTAGTLQSWAPFFNGTVGAIAVDASNIYVGAAPDSETGFTMGGSSARSNLAAFSASTGYLSSTFVPNPNNTVRALHAGSGRVFVGGLFTSIASSSRNYFASISSSGTLDTTAPTTNGFVYAIESVGGSLYLGGSFTQVTVSSTTSNRARLASFALSNWALQSWDPSANSTVWALEAMEHASIATPMMLVGGAFTQAGGRTDNYLAKIDTSTGLAESTVPFDPSITGTAVYAIAYKPGGNVYIGGSLTVGATTNFEVLDPDTGAATGANRSADGEVRALQLDLDNDLLYVGGAFDNLEVEAYVALGIVNTSNDSVPAVTFDVGVAASACTYSIVPSPGFSATSAVYFGGDFNTMNDAAAFKAPAPKLGGADPLDGSAL